MVDFFSSPEADRQEAAAGSAIVATVNGAPIAEGLLAAEVKQQLEKYSRYGMRQTTPELTATLRQQALDRIIGQELLRQASTRMVIRDAEEQTRRQAEELRSQLIKDSALLPQLANRYSGCARSKDQAGELGFIKRGFMPPEFDAAALALPLWQISEVVATSFGFHLIQVADKKPAGYAPLEEVHDFISKYLQGDMTAKRKALHIEELRKQAAIEVLLN